MGCALLDSADGLTSLDKVVIIVYVYTFCDVSYHNYILFVTDVTSEYSAVPLLSCLCVCVCVVVGRTCVQKSMIILTLCFRFSCSLVLYTVSRIVALQSMFIATFCFLLVPNASLLTIPFS